MTKGKVDRELGDAKVLVDKITHQIERVRVVSGELAKGKDRR